MTVLEQNGSHPGAAPTGPRLACAEVTVRFGGVVAVDAVSVAVPPGDIVGLVGPNGAGKSTLFGVLSGLLRPNSGRVFLDGDDITRLRPQRRAQRGLARTFQHPELFSGLTVRDHLVLAHRAKHTPRRVWSDLCTLGSLRRPEAGERARVDELLELLDLADIDQRQAFGLPLGLARLVEVGRALATAPCVLLLDEPSSGLSSADTRRLEGTLRRVAREADIAVLLVEHDVDLVMRLCSSVNVLDFGRLIASGPPAAVREDAAVRAAYLGEPATHEEARRLVTEPVAAHDNLWYSGTGPHPDATTTAHPPGERVAAPAAARSVARNAAGEDDGPAMLRVHELCVRYGDATALSGVSFELAAGQALAVLGPNGAGKSSLARALSGLVRPSSGRIELGDADVTRWAGHKIRRRGVVHLPESRGVFRGLTVTDNLHVATGTLPTRQARREAVDFSFELFPPLAHRRRQHAGLLSGGEQQMLSMARALATSPSLLVADEVSLGLAPIMVDAVFDGLVRARQAGVTIVMIEQYVHRALAFADRCIVLQRGELAWAGAAEAAKSEVLRHYLGTGMIAAS